jgi:hypothetical protein
MVRQKRPYKSPKMTKKSLKEKYERKRIRELKSLNEAFSSQLSGDLSKALQNLNGRLFSSKVFLKIPGMEKIKEKLISSFKFIMSDEDARNEDENAGFFKKMLGGEKGSLSQADADQFLREEVKKLEVVLSSIQNVTKTLREVMKELGVDKEAKGSETIAQIINSKITPTPSP